MLHESECVREFLALLRIVEHVSGWNESFLVLRTVSLNVLDEFLNLC